MFSDYFLRGEDALQISEAFLAAGIKIEVDDIDGVVVIDADGYTTDIIGMIYKPTGEYLEAEDGGGLQPVMAAIPGWHVNLRCVEALSAEQLSMLPILDPPPLTPERVFA